MDFRYQDHQGNGMEQGSHRFGNAWTRISNYGSLSGERHSDQNIYHPSVPWNDHPQEDLFVACNPQSAEFSSRHRKKEYNTFEDTVLQRLNALQAQMDKMALENEEVGLRSGSSTQVDLAQMETNLRSRLEEHLSAYAESLTKQIAEHFSQTAHMYEKLLQKFEDLQHELQSVTCWMIRLENRMEKEMGQLYCGMFKAQGRFDDSDSVSEGQDVCGPFLLEELPGYIAESIPEDPRNDSIEGCETISPMSSTYHENERLLCDDIASSRGSCLANEVVHIDDMREWDFMACSPVEQRDHSRGADLSLHPEDPLSPPTNRTCASSAHEDTSRASTEPWVDDEEQQRKGKIERRVRAQVWIPRGTLEVMGILPMTELSLGETSCVPHNAQKRRRRRKSSVPPGEVG